MPTDDSLKQHVVAVIGAATAGSEVARVLAGRGAMVLVIEQNPRPYGKIEDGLPRWHRKQRHDEYQAIDARLNHPNIEFIPLTRLGRDVALEDMINNWHLSAIVLASGAWRDRPFPVEGAERFVGRGLIYQNSLIYWFNHYNEAAYNGTRYDIQPGALVVGGGLASIDVVKVLQIETALRAFAARGVKVGMEELEREGIVPMAQAHGIDWAALGVAPCRLFYRRRVLDMPLSDIPADANPRRAEMLRQARAKILDKAQRKFLFEFQDQSVPTGIVERDGTLTGLRVSRTEVADGRVRIIPGSEREFPTTMVVSSIGSIPELLPGLPAQGEVYRYIDSSIGLILDQPTLVFAAGNVLSGKGNIKDSLESGTAIGTHVAEAYLGLSEGPIPIADMQRELAHEEAIEVATAVAHRPPLSRDEIDGLRAKVRQFQRAAGYEGNYRDWIEKVTPADLE